MAVAEHGRSEPARYRFGPLEQRGLIAGWRTGQVGTLAVSLIVAVILLRSGAARAGLAGALAAVVVGLIIACWPIRGRTAEQWAPVALSWVMGGLVGHHRYLFTVPSLRYQQAGEGPAQVGVKAPAGRGGPTGTRHRGLAPRARRGPPLPPSLAGCRILAPPLCTGGLRAGVVHDARARTYTGVLAASGFNFALLDPAEQQRRVAAWSAVLAGLAREGSPVHRLQWVERNLPWAVAGAVPDQGWAPGTVGDDPDDAAARSYAELVERTFGRARRHQVLLALSVRSDRARPTTRSSGRRDEGSCAVLDQELRSFARQLAEAEILVEGVLTPGVLARVLGRAIEAAPAGSHHGQAAEGGEDRPARGDGPPSALAPPWPWPLAAEASWAAYRTDGTWHATYWVAEWPRIDVGPGFLTTLLLHSGVRHTVSLTMEPIGALRAARDVRQARTADVADAELRRRGGFLASARRQRETELVARREVELADGHAQYRFSGYVTVTATTVEALEADCGRMEQAASQAGLELRRLYGQQDQAFTWTLPLARGLS